MVIKMFAKDNIIKNFLWRFVERCGSQIVQVLVFIILARILEPKDFGTISILIVFIAVLQVFIDSGLGTALIQKKDSDDLDFSSVFYFNIFICIILYILMFLAAPYISLFYKDTSFTSLLRVISLLLIISGVKNIQQAYVSKMMIFKKFFFATLAGKLSSAIIGISMAYNGYGIWSIVAQQLSSAVVETITLWFIVEWKPKLLFSLERLKSLLSYGWKLLVSALIDTIYNNLRQLIIGKLYTPIDLAFYNKGQEIPNLIIGNINASIDSILLPVMSNEQDNIERVKNITRKSIQVSVYIIAPIMLGIGVTSYSFVPLILTEKWLPCIPFLWIFCITFIFYPIHTANLNAIKALGRSDVFLILEVWKKVTGLIVLLLTMWHGIMLMAYSLLFTSFLSQIINSWPNKTLLNYGYIQQLKDILPSIFLACFTAGCMFLVRILHVNLLITLILQIFIGIIVYLIISYFLRLKIFNYLLRILKKSK